jgi:hypothetical protein
MANSLYGNINLQGSQPRLQGGFVGPVLQPAANPQKQGFVGPILQPAAPTPKLQPAVGAKHIQPAATAQQIQPAVGGVPAQQEQPIKFLDGSTFNQQGQQLNAPTASYGNSQYQPGYQPSSFGSSFSSSMVMPNYGTEEVKGMTQLASPMPQVDTSRLSELEKLVQQFYNPSDQELTYQNQLIDTNASAQAGIAAQRAKPIPMNIIRGLSQNILENSAIQEQTLTQKLALAQAKRQAALDASKFALSREDARIAAEKAAHKPTEISPGSTLIDPATGQVVYQAPAQSNPTSDQKDYQFAQTQGFGGSFLDFMQQKAMLNPSAYEVVTDAFGNRQIVSKLGGASSGVGNFNTGATGMRTDRHNNPTAFTTDIAKQAGLVEGRDYVIGDPFPNNPNLKTAKLLGDPIATTINVIDKIGFYTQSGQPRWTYVNQIPDAKNWANLSYDQKKNVIAQMYKREGGNGSLLGGNANNPAAAAYQQIMADPRKLSTLSQDQKTAINNYAIQNGLPLPTEQTTEAINKQKSLSVLQSTVNALEQLGNQIGWKGVGGAFQGSIKQFLAKNFGTGSQQEQMLRSYIGQVQGTIAKERGGTSFTPNEQALLESYTPTINDSPLVIQSKLQVLKQFLQNSNTAYGGNPSTGGNNSNDPLGLGI